MTTTTLTPNHLGLVTMAQIATAHRMSRKQVHDRLLAAKAAGQMGADGILYAPGARWPMVSLRWWSQLVLADVAAANAAGIARNRQQRARIAATLATVEPWEVA